MQEQAPAARGLLGALCAGDGKQLQEMSFYLDSVKARSVTLLVEAIALLGGKVESFLHKDVSFVVTGNLEEGLKRSCVISKVGASKGTSEDVCRSTQGENIHTPPPSGSRAHTQRPGTPRPPPCGSRGKALLEKAIRNNGQVTSVLANARSWGVKILFVDDVLLYLQRLSRDSFNTKHRAPPEQKNSTRCLTARVIKAVSLRGPFLKVEDLSRKFKPVLLQSMTMPILYYGGRFSPFEPPPPPRPEGKTKEKRRDKHRDGGKAVRSSQNKPQSATGLDPLPRQSRKKDTGYCECCHLAYDNQEQHLQSSEHRAFVLDASNYLEVNQLVADMHPGFSLDPPQQATRLPTTPPPIQLPSPAELEFLTDVEAEHALQALLIQAQAPSPHTKPLSSSPPGPLPVLPDADSQPSHPSPTVHPLGSQPSHPSPTIPPLGSQPSHPSPTVPPLGSQPSHPSPTVPPLGSQPSHPSPTAPPLGSQPSHPSATLPDGVGLGCPRSPDTDANSEPFHSSPATPRLDSQSDGPCSAVLRSDPPLLTPYSDSPDPYLLPPVLSPQVPYDLLEPHSPYSQTPILSPQVQLRPHSPYLPEDFDMEICPQTTGNGEGQSMWFNRFMNPSNSDELPGQTVRRSRSLPRLSTTVLNGGKRCCSASPERKPRKRRRVSSTSSQRLGSIFCPVTYNNKPVVEADLLIDMPANHTSVCSAAYSTVEHLYFNTDLQNFELCADKVHTGQLALATSLVPSLQNFPSWLGNISGLRSTSVKPTRVGNLTAQMPDLVLYSHCSGVSSEESNLSISSTLAPEMAALSPSSSDSDWDCELLARLDPNVPKTSRPTSGSRVLDQELLHRPCTGLNSNYVSRLHSALQSPPTPPPSFCGEETVPSAFSRTVIQIVEVQH